MMSGSLAQRFADLGWNKELIKKALWDRTKIPRVDLEKCGLSQWLEMDTRAAVTASLRKIHGP